MRLRLRIATDQETPQDGDQTPQDTDDTKARPRSHSDPSGDRSGQPQALSSTGQLLASSGTEGSTQIVQLDEVTTKSNYMRALVEMDNIASNLEAAGQLDTGPIDEISSLMQNCSISNVQDQAVDENHTFLEHFKIPISDWSLQLVATAKKTKDYRQLARVVVVLEHFDRVGMH
ncbi:hypothetical protein TWF506_006990 [Arthrobotrys conoides]|uniref:Uncharacterized protein n=1 Tax=Arthrobotrys conoides TaxID=74498 RepID=A0AAN8RW68_9PEZI